MGGRRSDGSDDGPGREWVFDDDFVAGGIREDSLRHRRATPSPRSSVGNPSGPRDWTPGWSDTSPRPPRNPYGVRMVVALLVAVALIVVVVRVTATGGHDRSTPIAITDTTTATSAATTTTTSVGARPSARPFFGLTPATPVGTCLRGTAPVDEDANLRPLSCRLPHDYELVEVERATGSDATYPGDSYWNGPVAQRCYADMRRYTGRERDEWPDHLTSTEFIPRPEGWSSGDRTVYCVAERAPATTGSVRHLPAAHPSGIATSAPPTTSGPATDDSDQQRTVTGRLFVQTKGSDVCLSVRSAAYTGPVVSMAAGLSWRASVDDAGRPDQAGSGIATAAEARADNIRWHAGDRVRLTGSVIKGYGQACDASAVFGFVGVRSAG